MGESRLDLAAFAVALTGVSAILINFHDQFWWPVDEGVYAYVAQRANAGAIIHRDIIDLHGGYGNLLNAWAFRMFGEDLLSLRYPLVFISFVQCMIVYILLRSHGNWVALVGTVTVAAFSFVQFPNPSANWHALGAFFCLCLCLEKMPKASAKRLLMAGAIVGVCFFTRQLSGVFLALGLIAVLLSEASRETGQSRLPAFVIGCISVAGLSVYLISKQQLFGVLWAGIWPILLLMIGMMRAQFSWSFTGRTVSLVVAGFLAAGAPLALVALSQDAFSHWVNDILFTALLINGQAFIEQASFLAILQLAWQNIAEPGNLVPILSGAAWLALVLCVPSLGIVASLNLYLRRPVAPSVMLAIFWGLGALHYQIPIYLFFVLPAILFAVLLIRPTPVVLIFLGAISGWALIFQAGQPLERGVAGTVNGYRSRSNVAADLPGVSLRIQPDDAALYRQVIDFIQTNAQPDELLMTLPMNPELNFMTGRASPVRYYGTPLGLRSDEDVHATLGALDDAAPIYVVHRRKDKYLTPLSATLLEQVQARSAEPVRLGPFDLYRYEAAPPETALSAER